MMPAHRRRAARNFATSSRRVEWAARSEEHTSELQSQSNLVCRLLLEKKKKETCTDSPDFAVGSSITGAIGGEHGAEFARGRLASCGRNVSPGAAVVRMLTACAVACCA